MHFNVEFIPAVEERNEVGITSLRSKRQMSLQERSKQCKDLALSQKSINMVSNVLGDINSIPIIGDIAGIVTAGVSVVTHLAEGGLDIAQTALDCSSVPFDDLKEFMQKQINEVNRKLDSHSAALEAVSRMVNKTLSAVLESREEMNERFDEVLESIESTKIEPIVSKINNFVRYFESEKERIRGLKEHQYVSKLEEKNSILHFFRESRTPMSDNSLNNALFDIIKHRYAVPDSSDDELSFKALYALLYGTEVHVSVMSFLIEQYSYLASYHYKRGEIDQYNECFDSINNIFSEFKSSLVGTGTPKGEPLLDQVIQTLIDVTNLDFLILRRYDIVQMIENKIEVFNKIKDDIRDMVPTITTSTPLNYVHISFDTKIGVPIGEWEKYKKVQYAFQYRNEASFSRVGEWSEPLTVNNYACPILRRGNDPSKKTILIFRKFQGSKSQLVGSVESNQQEFIDVSRDLYNAAKYPEQETGFKEATILLNKGANFTVGFEKGRNVLHAAAKSGNSELALGVLLRDNQKEINVVDEDGYTPMHIAADSGNAGFVRFLMNHGGFINAKTNRDQLTPLHLAARRGFLKTFKRLMQSPEIKINERNKEGFTPLHYAVLGGKLMVEAVIKNKETEINPKSTKKELTPFHMAVINNELPIVEILMKSQKVEINAGDKNNMTPLHYAVMMGHPDIVQYLLSLDKINPNLATNDNKWTPLHYAIIFKQDDIALKLINSSNIDNSIKADGDNTPLHFAVAFGRKNVVLEMLTKKLDLEITTKEGYTPLHLAAMRENPEILSLLLSNGANIEAKTDNDSTPLHLATSTGRTKTALSLLDMGANLKVVNKNGQTPLHLAAVNGQLKVIQKLLARDDSIIDMKNENLDTALNLAAQNSHTAIVKFLMDEGSDFNTRNKNGISPLIGSAKNGNPDMVKYLIEKGVDVYIADNNGNNFIYHAIRNDQLNVVKCAYMLNGKFDWNKIDDNRKGECDSLHKGKKYQIRKCSIEYLAVCDSIKYGKLNIVKYFIGELDKTLCEPLTEAARFGRLEIVKYLVEEKRMDINPYKDLYNDLNSPLCNAVKYGYLEIVRYLVHQGADIHTNCGVQLAMDFAIQYDHLNIVKFLSENGANLRKKNRLGLSPLDTTFRYHKFEILKYFIEEKTNQLDINEQSKKLKHTPLMTAIHIGRFDVVKSLVEKGADITLKNINGKTALDLAKEQRKDHIVKYLQSRSKRFFKKTMHDQLSNNFLSHLNLNQKIGYSNSKYINAENTLKRSNVDIRSVDVIGTLMLLDVIIKYFTNGKYISEGSNSVSDAEAQATALKITEKFEDLLNFFQNLPEEYIDFSEVHNDIYKALKSGQQDKIQQILCSSMKTLSTLTVEKMEELMYELMITHPPENSSLSIEESVETYHLLTQHCLGSEI